jgi:SynChlorMet cassette protein ScmC
MGRECWRGHFLEKASYVLKLDERCAWNLIGTGKTMIWLGRLAATMGLQPGYLGNYPSINYILGTKLNEPSGVRIGEPNLGERPILKKVKWEIPGLPFLRVWSQLHTPDLVCELSNTSSEPLARTMMWLSLVQVYERAILCGGIALHAALAERSGRAFLLAGDHGVGKTTCCSRLPMTWSALCDDETFVLSGGYGYYAHPFPTWSAYLLELPQQPLEVSKRVPLSAIFFLEKATRVEIVSIGRGEAAVRINESANQACRTRMRGFETLVRRELRTRILDNACKLAGQVPAYVLRISKTGRFWKAIEEVVAC